MSLKTWGLCVLAIGLSACGGGFNANNPADKLMPNGEKVGEASANYSQTAVLNLSHTQEDLKTVKSNALSFKGTGAKATYKATYNFNSLENTSFKVVSTFLKSQHSKCAPPQVETMTLNGKNLSKKLSLLDQVKIEPKSDYTLEITFKNSCDEIEMDFDLIAWAGTQLEDPKVAIACRGQQIIQATFFMNVNLVMGFSSVVGKEKFIAMDTYCGEAFRGTKTNCSGNIPGLSLDQTSDDQVSCKAETESEKREFLVRFSAKEDTAVVQCKTNDSETYSENFDSCQRMIIDYKPYSQLLLNQN